MTGRSDLCSYIGTTFTAKHWLSLDACGLLCISLSFSVHAYALVVVSWLLVAGSLFNKVAYVAFYIPATVLALCSLYMAWTTNPGAVPMGAKPLTTFKRQGTAGSTDNLSPTKRGIRRCHKCMDNYKPPRAHHDSVTGRCIVKMDHYCPWVCNAVGALNHKFFVLFIGYTLVSSLMALFMIVTRFIHCSSYVPASSDSSDPSGNSPQQDNANEEEPNVADPSLRFLQDNNDGIRSECNAYDGHSEFVLVLLVMSVIFTVFTSCMLLEQVDAIASNTWKIARMKLKVGSKGSTELHRVTQDFNEMFGGSSPKVTWHWFLPLQVKFPKGMRAVVLGYDYDETFCDGTPYDEEKDGGTTSLETSSQHSSSLSVGIDKAVEPQESFQDEPLDDDDNEEDDSLVASPNEEARLGSTKDSKKKLGMLKRRKDDANPKFVNRTGSLS